MGLLSTCDKVRRFGSRLAGTERVSWSSSDVLARSMDTRPQRRVGIPGGVAMKHMRIVPLIVLAVAFSTLMPATSSADLRFGPWVYWAPYYYPPPEMMQHLGFKPEDFAPRYQSPNPAPPPDCPPPPPMTPNRVVSKAAFKREVNGPVMEAPPARRSSPMRPGAVWRAQPPAVSPQPETVREQPQASPEPPVHRRFEFGKEKPRPVRSIPGPPATEE